MSKTALVSGAPDAVGEVASALERVGYATIRADSREALVDHCGRIPADSLQCYVQLPGSIRPQGDTVVARFGEFLRLGLLARWDAATCVVPLLAADAMVVLVAGNHPAGAATPDDRSARVALLRVLAHAILADRADDGVRASVVEHGRTPAEIAQIAVHHGRDRLRIIAEYSELAPEMSYTDWRMHVLELADMED